MNFLPTAWLCILHCLGGVICPGNADLLGMMKESKREEKEEIFPILKILEVVLRSLPNDNVHLVYQNPFSDEFVRTAQLELFVPLCLESKNDRFRNHFASRNPYDSYSQNFIFGDLVWTKDFVTEKTYWIMVTDFANSLNDSNQVNDMLNFVSDNILALLPSITKGLFIVHSSSKKFPVRPNVFRLEHKLQFSLKLAAYWTKNQGALKQIRPFWPKMKLNYEGMPLKLAVLRKPVVYEYEESDIRLSSAKGYISYLSRELELALNFKAIIVPSDGFGSQNANGSWNGMVAMLIKREADAATMDFSPSFQRAQYIDFGVDYSLDNVVIISKAPDIVVRPFLLLQIFSPLVWACLFSVALVSGFFYGVLTFLEKRRHLGNQINIFGELTAGIAVTLMTFINQPAERLGSGNSARTFFLFLLLTALIVVSVYKGYITAFLAIPFKSSKIDSSEDLVKSDTLPVARLKTSIYSFIKEQTEGTLGTISSDLHSYDDVYLSSKEFFNLVADGTYALIDTLSSAVGRTQQYQKRGARCLLYVGSTAVKVDSDNFAYPKNSEVREQFDYVMSWFKFFGIIEKFKKGVFELLCEVTLTSKEPTTLTVQQIQGAIYVYFVGLCLAILTFAWEMIF